MVPVTVENLSISKAGFVVLLKSRKADDDRTLPIYIGPPEAQSILFHLNRVILPRPMTHDLLKNVLETLGAAVDRADVHALRDGIFYAKLTLTLDGQQVEVDARPSDAIALALRCDAPIFVAEKVMDEDGIVLSDEDAADAATDLSDAKRESTPSRDEPEDPVDRLEHDLADAIAQERYEDAAALRDEIKRARDAN